MTLVIVKNLKEDFRMCIKKKINMKELSSNYLYQSLNESLNDCPSLLMIYQSNKSVFDRLFKATLKKGFTFTKLKENDIVKLTPAEAFKYGGKEGDKYIKLWLTSKKEVGIITSPYIPKYERSNGLGGVIIDTFLHSIVSEIRYPNKSIIMCVNEDKKVAFYQISYTKNDILFTFITPFYDRGTKPKTPLPEWSDGKFMHNSIMLYDLVGMYVIANSYNDFCKNKFLSFADNQKLDINAQNKYNELIAEKKAAAEAVKLSVKQENAEFSEKIKPFTEQAKKVKEKISAEIKAGINELIKSKPSTWNDVLSFWEYRIKEISKLMVKDNVSVFDGHIINTCGFYYAGETKNNVTVLKNLYGAPGVSFRASYIDESSEYRIKAFYEWVRKGRPSTDYDFLIPQTIISCNNGRIGIYSSGISIPAGENWHFSTNNGKNGNGTISLKTDGIFIATDHARRFGSLYTFK